MIPVVYIVVGVVLWPYMTRRVLVEFEDCTASDRALTVVLTGCAAAFWPVLVAAAVVRLAVRPRAAANAPYTHVHGKEERR